jgi:hypothetical protein
LLNKGEDLLAAMLPRPKRGRSSPSHIRLCSRLQTGYQRTNPRFCPHIQQPQQGTDSSHENS